MNIWIEGSEFGLKSQRGELNWIKMSEILVFWILLLRLFLGCKEACHLEYLVLAGGRTDNE